MGTACSRADPGMREKLGAPHNVPGELGFSEAQRFEGMGVHLPFLYLGFPYPFASRDSWEMTRDNDGAPLHIGHRMYKSA